LTAASLVLADGTVFRGRAAGAAGVAVGEVVFNTAMTGYQEILTDPSYAGQIIVMTAPHIGNYGVTAADDQAARPAASGLVVRSLSRTASSWRADGDLGDYLEAQGVVAISGVDTRKLTRHIRQAGVMAAALGTASDARLCETARAHGDMSGRDLTGAVTTGQPYGAAAQGAIRGHVVAYDLGIKGDIIRRLTERGLEVQVVPAGTPAAWVLSERPNGIFLSNGPGDPEPVRATIDAVRGLLGKLPVFGICLGHQMLGLALGASTYKLPFGHHGGNHPVRRFDDGKVEITSQNHGFAVDLWGLAGSDPPSRPAGTLRTRNELPDAVTSDFGRVAPTHQNLNDGTLEGLRCEDVAAFSVQYHPEAAPGPNDALAMFDTFAALVEAA